MNRPPPPPSAQAQGGPVRQTAEAESGGRIHTIGQNDNLTIVAQANGYLWSTVWDHPRNAVLRQQRSNPNQLVPGDELYLPPKDDKAVSKPVDALHTFKKKGEPVRLQLQLLCMDEPRAGERYTLTYADQVVHGSTDGQGRIDEPLEGKVQSVTLQLDETGERYEIAVGELQPVSELAGVQQRLTNLGYGQLSASGQMDEATRKAVLAFQRAQALEESGDIDAATRAALEQQHG